MEIPNLFEGGKKLESSEPPFIFHTFSPDYRNEVGKMLDAGIIEHVIDVSKSTEGNENKANDFRKYGHGLTVYLRPG